MCGFTTQERSGAILDPHEAFAWQIDRKVSRWLKQKLKLDPDLPLEPLLGNGREFVATTPCTLELQRSPLPFERPALGWFADLSDQPQAFDGARELAKVSRSLAAAYPDDLRRAHHREAEVAELEQWLFGPKIHHLALVAPPGSGRSTLVEAAFSRYRQRVARDTTKPANLYLLDPTRVISGMSVVGQWERRLEAILDFLARGKDTGRRHRLWIDNPVALLRVGKSAQSDLTLKDVLKPYLEEGGFSLILEATPAEWRIIGDADRRFADLFRLLRPAVPDVATVARMVVARRSDLEQTYDCRLTVAALSELFHQPRDRATAPPGAIIGPLERLMARHRGQTIDVDQVRAARASASDLRPVFLDGEQTLKAAEVHRALSQRLIGQPEAVAALVDVVQLIKAGLIPGDKPVATLLFTGPTGVGKTQAAKELARYLFTTPQALLRFDMNEYLTVDAPGRLMGDWRHPEGALTGAVRQRPLAVLLFDEIEKAHPSLHDLLLQLLGEGRLSDALGRTTDFSRCVVIMTSNLGAVEAQRQTGFVAGDVQADPGYRRAVERFFRPEFVNRIDRIIAFRPLSPGDARPIARLQLQALLKRDGLVRRTTLLDVSPEALDWVARRGFDPRLGGRALLRGVERDVATLVALKLVTLPPDQPLIMAIDASAQGLDCRLRPLVTQRRRVDPQRWLGASADGVAALIDALRDLQEQLYAWRRATFDVAPLQTVPGTLDPRQSWLLILQERLRDLLDPLEEFQWALETRPGGGNRRGDGGDRLQGGAQIPPSRRLSSLRLFGQTVIDDRYGRDDWLAYLEEVYVQAPLLAQQGEEQWLYHQATWTLTRLQLTALTTRGIDCASLSLTVPTADAVDAHLNYLCQHYRATLEALTLEVAIEVEGPRSRRVVVTGPGAADLCALEEGVHLFHDSHGAAVPVHVTPANLSPHGAGDADSPLLVLRHYTAPGAATPTGTLTDLTTGLMSGGDLGAMDWQLLWYGALTAPEPADQAVGGG
ncbi:MAG: AAA family ATPase [Candidatus Competibacterales bacterium]